jgi:hypothetical protein
MDFDYYMGFDYYYAQAKKLTEVTNSLSEKKVSFFQQILIVSATILGILVAFHTERSELQYTRWVFLASVMSLTLCILTSSKALYNLLSLFEKLRQDFDKELQNARREGREVNPVFVSPGKMAKRYETCSWLSFILGVFALAVYACLCEIG